MAQDRSAVSAAVFNAEGAHVDGMLTGLRLDAEQCAAISMRAAARTTELRAQGRTSLLERWLAEYGLDNDEGIALMCLAEAFLRTPDAPSLDALIADKIGGGDWSRHRGKAASSLVNASTWALLLTGRALRHMPTAADDLSATMHGLVQRLGEPVARMAVGEALRLLARQFVLGRSIAEALQQAAAASAAGYLHSFDMLGEAASTAADARRYFLAYANAIAAISAHAADRDPHGNSGISVKLSALHPRYEQLAHRRVMAELVPRVHALAVHARAGNIGFNIDAEEAERLDLSLAVIEAVLEAPDLAAWSGFGVAVQAYAKTAPATIDWLHGLCRRLDRRIAVRLVKGAYWDSEIKRAQILGLPGYAVLTRKTSTDLSYLCCAERLFSCAEHIYPQFATHNAHTVCAINAMAPAGASYEFQRLLGMGEALHELLRAEDGRRRRIYAPVGVHRDLLAYLVRRLLENGANSSFVHQLIDTSVPAAELAADPVSAARRTRPVAHPAIAPPPQLFGATRRNAQGYDLANPHTLAALELAMVPFRRTTWQAVPTIAGSACATLAIVSPTDASDRVGNVQPSSPQQIDDAVRAATAAFPSWQARPVVERAALLERAAELYEQNTGELLALAAREAGKTRRDALAELREAVDLLRYYAAQARATLRPVERAALGPFVCISPWNFPLAIFTGQVAAALVAGNTVVAKPAEQTPLMAARAVALLHLAGVPHDVLILLPGDGEHVGSALTCDPRVAGVCFTGSLASACRIDAALAAHLDPYAVLIAETGGVNAMIVDSTALPEQVVRDVLASAFHSAGQRCSALRALFLQREIAATVLTMLEGAARELELGDPWSPATDVGPVIDAAASGDIGAHCAALEQAGQLLFRVPLPAACAAGSFVAPVAFRLAHFDELKREVFGPVLHVIIYEERELDSVVSAINAAGYGLTLGVHSRVDARVDRICAQARVGNIYVNRNQIGAVVGAQPFGGMGLSGTGPKAGGPQYVLRFTRRLREATSSMSITPSASLRAFRDALPAALQSTADTALARAGNMGSTTLTLAGVTGERNTYSLHPRGTALCLGAAPAALTLQVSLALATGNRVLLARMAGDTTVDVVAHAARAAGLESLRVQDGALAPVLASADFDLALFDGDLTTARQLRKTLAARPGPRIPLLGGQADAVQLCVERVICEDTTAAGGNASLLALSH